MVSASTKNELISKLYELCKSSETLTSIYPDWEVYCKEAIGNTAKTIKEHFFIWKNQLSKEAFANKPINDLTVKGFLDYFRRITAKREITYQRFSDIRSVLNGLLYYCVEQELLSHNFISDINCRQFKFKAVDDDVIPYAEEERHKMIDYLAPFNDIYSLAFRLDFCLISRIGEIKALRFDDVKKDAYGNIGIKLSRFMDNNSNIQSHIKGHASDGFR